MSVAPNSREQTFHLASGRIALRVMKANGGPATNVRMQAGDLKLPPTDNEGCTLYEHAPPGAYKLFVMAKGFRAEGADAAAYRKARIPVGECVAAPDAAELQIQLPTASGY